MSKYVKIEDAMEVHKHFARNGKLAGNIIEEYNNLPTIEVKGGDLEDAILLTKDAYSDLCLKASQVSGKAECDNCIWNTCNYNKIDWEVSEDCIGREYLEEEYWQTLIPKEAVNTDVELGINIGIEKMHNVIKDAPNVLPKRSCYRCGLREDCADSTVLTAERT